MFVQSDHFVFRALSIQLSRTVGLICSDSIQPRPDLERRRPFLLAYQSVDIPLLLSAQILEFVDQVQYLDACSSGTSAANILGNPNTSRPGVAWTFTSRRCVSAALLISTSNARRRDLSISTSDSMEVITDLGRTSNNSSGTARPFETTEPLGMRPNCRQVKLREPQIHILLEENGPCFLSLALSPRNATRSVRHSASRFRCSRPPGDPHLRRSYAAFAGPDTNNNAEYESFRFPFHQE